MELCEIVKELARFRKKREREYKKELIESIPYGLLQHSTISRHKSRTTYTSANFTSKEALNYIEKFVDINKRSVCASGNDITAMIQAGNGNGRHTFIYSRDINSPETVEAQEEYHPSQERASTTS